MRQRPMLLLWTVALVASCHGSQEEKNHARMDQIVRVKVDNKDFSGSVLVASGNHIILNKSYGLANIEWNIPNTPTTKFRVGSVTKQFTAAAILLLEEQGKLKTDDLVKTHWAEAPAAWNKVTIFHLLTHTSGIPNPDDEPWRFSEGPTEKTIGYFRDKPLNFEPGSQYSYSNAGYIVLAYLIEKVSGQSYGAFIREKIFTPLGMKNSVVDSTPDIVPNRASGYTDGTDEFVNASYINLTSSVGSGALYSTTEDLLRWTQGLFAGKLLSAASLEKMTTPFKEDYALGLEVSKDQGHKIIWHGGSIAGFNSTLIWFPDEKMTIVVLANLEGDVTKGLAKRLSSVMHGKTVVLPSERREIKLPEDALKKFTGIYEVDPDTNLVIAVSNGRLKGFLGTQKPKELLAESATRFFLREVDGQLEFKQDSTGTVTGAVLFQDGEQNPAKRLPDRVEAILSAEMLPRYAGTYQPAPDVAIVITVDDGHLMVKIPSERNQELFAEAEDRFFFKTFNAQVEFTRNKNGQVTDLILHRPGREDLRVPRHLEH
jgi:CubicO group peptidase (beta-lactamase class C family)